MLPELRKPAKLALFMMVGLGLVTMAGLAAARRSAMVSAPLVTVVARQGAAGWSQLIPSAAAAAACPANSPGTATTIISVPTTTTYRLWARIKGDANNNSFLLQLDSGNCYTVGNVGLAPGQWIWVDYQDGSDTNKLNLSLTSGGHGVKLYHKEAGVEVDRLMLISDGCLPTGIGDKCAVTPPPPAPPPPPPPVLKHSTFVPSDDSYVKQTEPNRNFDNFNFLRVSNSAGTVCSAQPCNASTRRIYLKFPVVGINGDRILEVRLRLWVNEGAASGGQLFSTDNLWNEATLTWANKRPVGSPVTFGHGPVDPGGYAEWVLDTRSITSDGSYSLVITNDDQSAAEYASRESGNHLPQLLVTSQQPLPPPH